MPRSFDTRSPPFDRLGEAEAAELVAALDIGYFRAAEVILERGAASEHFHVVLKGQVEELDDDGHAVAVLGPKEAFGSRAVVHGGAGARYVAVEETLTYLIPRATLLALMHKNPGFAAFFYSDLSRKLAEVARADHGQGIDGVLRARIAEARLRPPSFISAAATIREAGRRMAEVDSNALFVHDGERVGIVTGMNLAKAVILDAKPLDMAVRDVAHYEIVAVDEQDFVFDALIAMTRHNKRRLMVTRDGEPSGILEDIDILGLFAGNSQLIPGRIDRARGLDDLTAAAADIQSQVERLHRQGVRVRDIAAITSDLNRHLFAKLFAMIAPESIRSSGCLIVMGSEGRGEQTIRTDQDNGLLLAGPVPAADLERFRREFQGALAGFGFPPCPGNVMVSNPIWSQPVDDFVAQLRRWVRMPDAESPMHLGIFFDAVSVAGNPELLARAKAEFIDLMAGETAALAHFAQAIDQFPGPGGVFGTILATVGREEPIDIKKSGIFPIVHGIRSLAIEKSLSETGTVDRIERLREQGFFDEAFARELEGAFGWFVGLRLKSQIRAHLAGTTEGESLVRLSDLSTLDRDLLRDALRVVKRFRDIVRNHYKLGMF
ncbi:cyclic nucleotide-binding/CBS domain-containing protein [Siculibacillus lacustris]|uniref:Cyclic nucleotide-binding/CBS domain-containing protein n=1 Tax=Siculibacillus lacustris TaxID=1549641 RepID=A0A4Q9VT19_9HYPH|nr:putative nucleotidyltransferase substrate binding domain-containing protein [Siculibacillus lacustris]TBW39192.1 cyclic nucleotide-binding/CBS domain-containing protein [Siculibacillus lacustris]